MIKNNKAKLVLVEQLYVTHHVDEITMSGSSANNDPQQEKESDVLTAKPQLEKPAKYAVVMHNDDYTPMDFVVYVLMSEFKHSEDDAMQIMLNIHNKGKGVAGIYSKEIAETKAINVNSYAEQEGFPLMTTIEPQ